MQPSQNVSEEQVTVRAPVGREHVGGSGGILPREIFEI